MGILKNLIRGYTRVELNRDEKFFWINFIFWLVTRTTQIELITMRSHLSLIGERNILYECGNFFLKFTF